MPEMSGLEALRQIKAASPETEVLIFSADASEEIFAHAFDAGAKSYIRKADAGGTWWQRFVSCDRGKKRTSANGKLTAREREILRLLAEGGSNKETATLLGISVRTAETHRAGLMRKLGLGSVAALVRYAIRNHVIEA